MKMLIRAVRLVLFSMLVFIRPVIGAVFGLLAGLCLIGFVFCLLFARHETTPLFAFLGFGVGLTLLLWIYDDILGRLAPENYVIIAER
jgi:hypothetical protein